MSKFVPVIGKLGPEYMGGPFRTFDTGKVNGLACHVSEKRVDLLAIVAKYPGRGDTTAFIDAMQKTYGLIIIWQVQDERMLRILHKAGFKPGKMDAGDAGLLEDVYKWEVPR